MMSAAPDNTSVPAPAPPRAEPGPALRLATAPADTGGPSARPVREIADDVGADGQDVSHDGDLRILGSVCSAVTINVAGELTIDGSVEAATIVAGGSVTTKGSIVGRGKAQCRSGGSVTLRSANAVSIEAIGDISVEVEIANCRLIAGGGVSCESGHVFAGHITANGGLSCSVLGSSSATETLVELGIDERIRRVGQSEVKGFNDAERRVQRIRSQLGPLMANPKALTPKQKETATELLYDADNLESKSQTRIEEIRNLLADVAHRAKQELVVTGTIHPGVTIRFQAVEMRVDRQIKGPVRLVAEGTRSSARIVMTNLKDNAEIAVAYRGYSDSALTEVAKLFAKQAAAERKQAARAA